MILQIKLVRGVMDQAHILAQDAMLPACAQLEDFKLSNLLSDGAVDLPMLKELIATIQDVEPVVSSSIDAKASEREGRIKTRKPLYPTREITTKIYNGMEQHYPYRAKPVTGSSIIA